MKKKHALSISILILLFILQVWIYLSILLAFYSYITFSKSSVAGYMVNQNEEENEAIIYEIYNSILLSFYSSFCYHAVGTLDPKEPHVNDNSHKISACSVSLCLSAESLWWERFHCYCTVWARRTLETAGKSPDNKIIILSNSFHLFTSVDGDSPHSSFP